MPSDLVPVPILAVTVRRGAVLLGAYDVDRLVGFVFSLAALRRGRWCSSSVALVAHARRGPAASRQRPRREPQAGAARAVLGMGLDLIEWTYDPLQSINAHLNFAKLGVIVEEYVENIYGESTSALHGGLPTDRFICQWWIHRPHVVRRIAPVAIRAIDKAAAEAPVVNRDASAWRILGAGWLRRGRTDRATEGRDPARLPENAVCGSGPRAAMAPGDARDLSALPRRAVIASWTSRTIVRKARGSIC